jgi:phosphate-selective porin OprO/OprP
LPRSDSSREGGAGARDNPPETDPTPGRPVAKLPARVSIGPGFVVETEDDEFQLQFHDQTQVEWRIYQQAAMRPANSGFWVARERLIFNGRLTKPIEYEGSIEYSYGAINILNAFLTWHPDDRFLVKGGRFKVPFGYEYYAISNVDLLSPERSLFGVNYGLNRMPGAMVYGQLLDKRLDYAVGLFDGPRNQAVDYNADKDVIAYLNARPFEKAERLPFLHFLNLGGSVDAGNQFNPTVPQALRTSVSQSPNPILSQVAPAFLTFNNNVIENGWRTMWSLHAAYFYRRLSIYGEWQTASVAYAKAGSPARTALPVDGFYLTAGYFLTGEHVNRRSQVKPLHRFDLRKGKRGFGALELQARYSTLHLGNEVFTAGLVDPNLWSNKAQTVDIGLNWYWNEYVKIYLDWQHSEFGAPVEFAPGRFQKNCDLFWIRGQVYF